MKTNYPQLCRGHTSQTGAALPVPSRATRFHPRPRIGVALSIGGARGLAHVGVIQVLEENGIPVDAIAGCSMGAYVGALWASGLSSAELVKLAAEFENGRDVLSLVDLAPPFTKGLVHGLKAKARLEKSIGHMTFEELKTPFLCLAASVRTLRRRVFATGPVSEAVHASCAIPGVCVPVKIGDDWFVDGGVVEPVPVPALRQHSDVDRVIAVNVLPSIDKIGDAFIDPLLKPTGWRRILHWINRSWNVFAPGNLVEILQRSIFCGQIRMAEDACAEADVVIQPHIPKERWHDYQNWREYIRLGRAAALEALPRIQLLLTEPVQPPLFSRVAAPTPAPHEKLPHSPLGLALR